VASLAAAVYPVQRQRCEQTISRALFYPETYENTCTSVSYDMFFDELEMLNPPLWPPLDSGSTGSNTRCIVFNQSTGCLAVCHTSTALVSPQVGAGVGRVAVLFFFFLPPPGGPLTGGGASCGVGAFEALFGVAPLAVIGAGVTDDRLPTAGAGVSGTGVSDAAEGTVKD